MNNDRIEVSFDGEEEPQQPQQPQRPQQPQKQRLLITNDDLKNIPDTPAQVPQQNYGAYPGYTPQFQKKTGAVEAIRGGVAQSLIAGLIGGFIAWMITEPLFGNEGNSQGIVSMLVEMGIFGALIGGVIGCCLGAAEGVMSQVYEKALRAGSIGLGIGAAGGFFGGVFGQLVYGGLLSSGGVSMATVMVARVIGWGVVGIFVGLGQGVGRGSGKRVVNGLVGGLVGGLVAGLLFDPIGMVVGGGLLSRMVGITILGAASGAAIGLVEEVRKEAWLSVVQGPLSGKQFILYEQRTRIGSSPKCEITLIKDIGILPEHVAIENQGSAYVLTTTNPQAQALVNGQPTTHARLQSGSVITLGATSLLFEEKALSKPMQQH